MNLIGALNANEIRSLEDMNSYDGGDTYFVQANMQTIEKATTISAPEDNDKNDENNE